MLSLRPGRYRKPPRANLPTNLETTVKHAMQAFIRDEAAVSSIEYALIGILIAVVILAAITSVGTQLLDLFNFVSSQVDQAIP